MVLPPKPEIDNSPAASDQEEVIGRAQVSRSKKKIIMMKPDSPKADAKAKIVLTSKRRQRSSSEWSDMGSNNTDFSSQRSSVESSVCQERVIGSVVNSFSDMQIVQYEIGNGSTNDAPTGSGISASVPNGNGHANGNGYANGSGGNGYAKLGSGSYLVSGTSPKAVKQGCGANGTVKQGSGSYLLSGVSPKAETSPGTTLLSVKDSHSSAKRLSAAQSSETDTVATKGEKQQPGRLKSWFKRISSRNTLSEEASDERASQV